MLMDISDNDLLVLLQALELELQRPAARGDAGRLAALLHDDFREFGRSGTAYTRADTLSLLPAQAQHASLLADRFALRRLAPGVALLTYRSANVSADDGSLQRFTLRTSVWEWSGSGWRMRFHQGTPTAPYLPE